MARLTILLPGRRDRAGRAVLASAGGELLFGPFRILGTASRLVSRRNGNRMHDRLLPFGDPPCGTYLIASTLPPGSLHARRPGRFGKLGALVLQPTGGEALDAKEHGRDHIVLHGGPRDAQHRLRRTRGGLRVGNHRLSGLFAAINRTQAAGDPLSVIEVVDVGVGFETEPPLPPPQPHRRRNGKARREQRAATSQAAIAPGIAVAAMAMFGITKATPTRRGFLATALLAVAGSRLLAACADSPAPCVDVCSTKGSGSGSGSGFGSGSAVAASQVTCTEVCDDDYGTGGGVG